MERMVNSGKDGEQWKGWWRVEKTQSTSPHSCGFASFFFFLSPVHVLYVFVFALLHGTDWCFSQE